MGLDVPPDKRVKANEVPRTQNDFLLMLQNSQKVLEKNPKDASALLELGFASRNLNDLERDVQSCTKAIELDPKFAAAYAERGLAHEAAERFAPARADFDKAIELEPKNAAYQAHLGRLFLREKKFSEAIAQCSKSIELDAQSAAVYYYRGKAHVADGDFNKALADFDQAVKLDPHGDVGFYIDRASARTKLNSIDGAIEDLRSAVRLDADDFPRQMDIAFTKGESEKTPEARQRILDLAKELIDVKPQSQGLRKALFYSLLGKNAEAITEFDKAAQRYPNQSEVFLYRGQTFAGMNENDKALADFTSAIRFDQSAPDAYMYRAKLFMMRHEYTKAIADLDQVNKIRPNRFAYMMRAAALQSVGDFSAAAAARQDFMTLAKTTHIAKDSPKPADSSKLLQRDLDDYFKGKVGKAVHVDFEALPCETTTGLMFVLPRSYYWVKIVHDGKLIDQGAACLYAVQKERYVVHVYASITEIKKRPGTIDGGCPLEVRTEIYKRAGLTTPRVSSK